MKRKIIVAITLMITCGCSNSNPNSNSNEVSNESIKVNIGMAMTDVETILGKPSQTFDPDGEECYWFYEGSEDVFAVRFKDSIVASTGKISKAGFTKRKLEVARTIVKNINAGCQAYKLDIGAWPENIEDLYELNDRTNKQNWKGPYLDPSCDTNDPWGNDYLLVVDKTNNKVVVSSMGPDGKKGTEDDISSDF